MPGYISEIDYYGGASVEWVEIAIPTGTDVSSYSLVMYTSSGYVDVTLSLGTVQSTAGGHDVYLVNAATPGWPGLDQGEGVALVDDTGTVQQFLSYKGFTVTARMVRPPERPVSMRGAGPRKKAGRCKPMTVAPATMCKLRRTPARSRPAMPRAH